MKSKDIKTKFKSIIVRVNLFNSVGLRFSRVDTSLPPEHFISTKCISGNFVITYFPGLETSRMFPSNIAKTSV